MGDLHRAEVLNRQLGWSPVYRAAMSRNIETVRLLLEEGADPNVKTSLGETPLHQAVDTQQMEVAKLLLRHRANPNAVQNNGETPLHYACLKGGGEMVSLLVQGGADPNLPSHSVLCIQHQRTPLHYAADLSSDSCVKKLLEAGADPSRKDQTGQRAQDLARSDALRQILQGAETRRLESSEESATKLDCRMKPLHGWLGMIGLPQVYGVLTAAGFESIEAIVQIMLGDKPLGEQDLKEFGVKKPGHRKKLMLRICQEARMVPRLNFEKNASVRRGGVLCCNEPKNSQTVRPLHMIEWLDSLCLGFLLGNFEDAGYDDFEVLVNLMLTSFALTEEDLKRDVGIASRSIRGTVIQRLELDASSLLAEGISEEQASVACSKCVLF